LDTRRRGTPEKKCLFIGRRVRLRGESGRKKKGKFTPARGGVKKSQGREVSRKAIGCTGEGGGREKGGKENGGAPKAGGKTFHKKIDGDVTLRGILEMERGGRGKIPEVQKRQKG